MGTRATGEGRRSRCRFSRPSYNLRCDWGGKARQHAALVAPHQPREYPATSADTMAAMRRCSVIRANQSQTVAQGSHSRIVNAQTP